MHNRTHPRCDSQNIYKPAAKMLRVVCKRSDLKDKVISTSVTSISAVGILSVPQNMTSTQQIERRTCVWTDSVEFPWVSRLRDRRSKVKGKEFRLMSRSNAFTRTNWVAPSKGGKEFSCTNIFKSACDEIFYVLHKWIINYFQEKGKGREMRLEEVKIKQHALLKDGESLSVQSRSSSFTGM